MKGLIVKAISSFYYVDSGGEMFECKARGIFRKNGVSPVVGDLVEFTPAVDNKGVIEQIKPRKSLLKRPLVANIDKLFIVSSYKTPSPDFLMIDRLCAASVAGNIKPIFVFNKSDEGDMSSFADIYKRSGFATYVVSALKNAGMDSLRKEAENCICAFAGNSGVGKSSIINSIFGKSLAQTGEVSQKLGRGRHTTRHTVLYKIGSSYIADTPGFAALQSDSVLESVSLEKCFPDFEKYINNCRFSGCSHTCEPGCGLIEAVKNGDVQKTRHDSYITLFNEQKNAKKW